MLKISALSMSAGSFSLKNVNLEVPEGSCHVLLGGTGNGKTLILETIAGLRPIISGEIWVDGYNITKLPPEKRFISYVPQDLALFPHLNVEKNIFYSYRFKNSQKRDIKEIWEIIKCMQLEDILHRSIHNLSGGEQQRVALVRALANGNKVLLLDEPFSALHYSMKRDLWSLLSHLQKKYDLSILLVTHDLEEAFFLADYVSIINQGRILQSGNKEEIFEHPNSIEATKIIGHYNYFSGKVLEVLDKHCTVNISKMGINFRIKNNDFASGDKVRIAIKTSSINIIPICRVLNNSFNTIECKIESIYETTHYHQIVLKIDNKMDNTDYIVIDIYDKRQIADLKIGQRVAAYFPEDSILTFKDKR